VFAKLARVLSDPCASVIVVEHRDRLVRFGVEPVHAVLAAKGRRAVVFDDGEISHYLVRDMIEVVTSTCADLHGQRGVRNQALRVTATNYFDASEAR